MHTFIPSSKIRLKTYEAFGGTPTSKENNCMETMYVPIYVVTYKVSIAIHPKIKESNVFNGTDRPGNHLPNSWLTNHLDIPKFGYIYKPRSRITLERMDPTRRDSQPVHYRSVFHRVGVARKKENPNIRAIGKLWNSPPLRRTPPPEVDPVWTARIFAPVLLSQLGGGYNWPCMGKWRPKILGGTKGEVSCWVVPPTTNPYGSYRPRQRPSGQKYRNHPRSRHFVDT
jgi:hypothetical protein